MAVSSQADARVGRSTCGRSRSRSSCPIPPHVAPACRATAVWRWSEKLLQRRVRAVVHALPPALHEGPPPLDHLVIIFCNRVSCTLSLNMNALNTPIRHQWSTFYPVWSSAPIRSQHERRYRYSDKVYLFAT